MGKWVEGVFKKNSLKWNAFFSQRQLVHWCRRVPRTHPVWEACILQGACPPKDDSLFLGPPGIRKTIWYLSFLPFSLLSLLGWHQLIKLCRFQGCNSNSICALYPVFRLLLSPFISLSYLLPTPFPLVIAVLLCLWGLQLWVAKQFILALWLIVLLLTYFCPPLCEVCAVRYQEELDW